MTNQDDRTTPVDPADIAMLAEEIGPRPPGSPQERRAVELVRERLGDAGIASVTLPIRTARRAAPVYTVLLALDALGVLLALYSAAFGFIVSLAAVILLGLELATYPLLSRIGREENSSNLLGIIPARGAAAEGELAGEVVAEPRRLVVLTAHLDTSRGVSRHDLAGRLHPLALAVLAAALLTPLALLLVALTGSIVFRALAGVGFVVQVVAVVALAGGLARSRQGSGADDNASGVAALLGVARELEHERPEQVETWLLFTSGADDGRSGMVQFLSENRFDPAATDFIDVDRVGAGQLCYTRGEGLVAPLHSSSALIHLAEEAAAAHPDWRLGTTVSRWPGSEFAILIRGYPALAITGCPAEQTWRMRHDGMTTVQIDNVEHAAELVVGMIRALDTAPTPVAGEGEGEGEEPAETVPESATEIEIGTETESESEEIWRPGREPVRPPSGSGEALGERAADHNQNQNQKQNQ